MLAIRPWFVEFRALAIAALLCTLAACGGGGGSSDSPLPPAPQPVAITKAEAFRFLNQASFGASDTAASQVITQGYDAWIDAQIALPRSEQLPVVQTAYAALTQPVTNIGQLHGNRVSAWFENSVRGQDQLRQRVAFALSEIMVISQVSLNGYPYGVADYYDMLARDAFGNFRTLMQDVTLHPTMGVYLSMLGNRKPDAVKNIRPDENYARELMQLFTVGLVQLNIDGSVKRDALQQPLPTFDQNTIEGFAHVFTGWNWSGGTSFDAARPTLANQVVPMQAYSAQHDLGAKQVLAYTGATATLAANQTAEKDLADALDNIYGHPNVAPFIAKQLIQRLVTSNPSPQYIERIATKFNNDGAGVRGNLGAVVKAILLDAEARTAASATTGKVKEPLLRLTQLWRAYNVTSANGMLAVANVNGNVSAIFGQGPLQAGSVFNFFSPAYAPSGEIANANLVAPELQISNEYLNTQVTNYFYGSVFCYVPTPVTGCPALKPDTVVLDTAAEMALVNDSAVLVDKIADRLLAGQISSTLRSEARAQVERVPVTLPSLRVAEALYLIATSPEYTRQN